MSRKSLRQPAAAGGIEGVVEFYTGADEAGRLASGLGRLEFVRTQEILTRYLPAPPAVILDIGGAAGRYSFWLAGLGYGVHLSDPVPAHIEAARREAAARPSAPLLSVRMGDARAVDMPDSTADAVLLLGPLYHLVEAADRRLALREAGRVLKPGGCLFAAGISRFASTLDGLANGYLADDVFVEIVNGDLDDGLHRNPTGNPAYFTDGYFHRPEELRAEIEAAGFAPEALLVVDPFAYNFKNLEAWWADPGKQGKVLDLLRRVESEPSLLGVGPHLMGVARKPA